MTKLKLAALVAVLGTPVLAEGDAAAGEELFGRQCVSCHVVANAEGEVLAGRNARTGPNLFGIVGGPVGAVEGYNYGEAIVAAGEAGAIWDEDTFVAYVQDPTDWLRVTLDDRRARSKMSFRVRSEDDAEDIYAYLATFSAGEGEEEAEAE
ncbi:c-type cytochrome [Marivivens marinus]|uniref:c-type cytochrome n=1 Tax=Marivivens marinus TaxID=3110173 RepID=UPI003B845F2C